MPLTMLNPDEARRELERRGLSLESLQTLSLDERMNSALARHLRAIHTSKQSQETPNQGSEPPDPATD